MQKSQAWKPCAPEHNLFHFLHIHNTKYEDELVENKVPKLVFNVLQTKQALMFSHDNQLQAIEQDDELSSTKKPTRQQHHCMIPF